MESTTNAQTNTLNNTDVIRPNNPNNNLPIKINPNCCCWIGEIAPQELLRFMSVIDYSIA